MVGGQWAGQEVPEQRSKPGMGPDSRVGAFPAALCLDPFSSRLPLASRPGVGVKGRQEWQARNSSLHQPQIAVADPLVRGSEGGQIESMDRVPSL